MNSSAALIHLLGFSSGIVLYAMLGVMTLRAGRNAGGFGNRADRIPLATSLLGLLWNVGALVVYGTRDLGGAPNAWLEAAAFAALGFLPAVVVHASLQSEEPRSARSLVVAAYVLSAAGALVQLHAAWAHQEIPASFALSMLTAGYIVVIALLALLAPRGPRAGWTLSAVALAAFAVMALHLQRHTTGSESVPIELVGHHASLPLALVILYQDYRFALADIFLKRVLTLLAVVLLAGLLYAFVAVPVVLPNLAAGNGASWAVSALIALWVVTALAYPALERTINRFVDRIVLRRADYEKVRADVAAAIAKLSSASLVLDTLCERIAPAMSAREVAWAQIPEAMRTGADGACAVTTTRAGGASVMVPTTEAPPYRLSVNDLAGGRRLFSGDLALLETLALLAARRIDALRVSDERHRRDLREREIVQLAAEAELSSLRAQLNPHFLFNTLTTIGQLIQEAPPRALDTLYKLTGLLRAVLKRSDGGFVTLGEEIEIVRTYLAIEGARFEERLDVSIDVPGALLDLPVPPLVLQPLAENAVKHGIAPMRDGGRVRVAAEVEGDTLLLSVTDSGAMVPAAELARRRGGGIGISNLEKRLERYYGDSASLTMHSSAELGTRVSVRIALSAVGGARRPRHAQAERIA
ncbi:MAG: histidine kinase [Gemmatimonadaceae bacterium]|nr:histidine kinase [Gemmatimonadaceae bacterium]